MSKLIPTGEQTEVLSRVTFGAGNILLSAGAGCAKTSTLLMAAELMTGDVGILAFNRDIANEIETKVAQMPNAMTRRDGVMVGRANITTSTFHALGWAAWRTAFPNCKIEGKKKGNAGYKKFDRIAEEISIPVHYRGFVKKAMSYARQRAFGYLTRFNDPQEWLNIVDHFDLEEVLTTDLQAAGMDMDAIDMDALIKDACQMSLKALRLSIQIADQVVDFDDMLYMPLIGNIRMRTYDWLLVDEAQDTNPVRRAMAKKVLRPGGRAIFVGDRCQSIYGFTGADPDAMDIIKHDFNCDELRLSETFRCPKVVVQRQQHIAPGYRAAASNRDGEIRTVDEKVFFDTVLPGLVPARSTILCRNTKPLVDLAFNLIKRGVPCYVEGKDIGGDLMMLINRWKRVESLAELMDRLEEYRDRETQRLLGAGKEEQADKVHDRVDTVLALISGLPSGAGVDDLRAKADELFADTPKGKAPTKLVLMTGHRSKGLEYEDEVVIWGANAYQPSKYARKKHQVIQETNLAYVMETRTKNRLTHVNVVPPSREERRAA